MPSFRQRLRLLAQLCILIAIVQSCGPELSEPNHLSVSGHWTSTDAIGPVSDIALVITQNADGTVAGTWSAKFFPPTATCPPELNATPTGPVSGTNTVLDIHLVLLGVGDFRGQLIGGATLKGGINSCDIIYPATFSLVGPAPTG